MYWGEIRRKKRRWGGKDGRNVQVSQTLICTGNCLVHSTLQGKNIKERERVCVCVLFLNSCSSQGKQRKQTSKRKKRFLSFVFFFFFFETSAPEHIGKGGAWGIGREQGVVNTPLLPLKAAGPLCKHK